MWNGRFASLQRSRCLFSIFHSNEPFFRCELQQPTNQLFHSGTVSLLSLSVDGRRHRGRTAISWPFRLLCFRSSLKIQMTSRPARPHLPSFSPPIPSIGLSATAAAAADSITSFSSLKKAACLPASLRFSGTLLSSLPSPFHLNPILSGSDRPHAGKVKWKNRPAPL